MGILSCLNSLFFEITPLVALTMWAQVRQDAGDFAMLLTSLKYFNMWLSVLKLSLSTEAAFWPQVCEQEDKLMHLMNLPERQKDVVAIV